MLRGVAIASSAAEARVRAASACAADAGRMLAVTSISGRGPAQASAEVRADSASDKAAMRPGRRGEFMGASLAGRGTAPTRAWVRHRAGVVSGSEAVTERRD